MAIDHYISVKDAFKQVLGITPATGYKWIRLGLIPAPIKLGPKRSVYKMSELIAFVDAKERGIREPAVAPQRRAA
jgi:predicted DNA-binding transcriptional regulator AlpA